MVQVATLSVVSVVVSAVWLYSWIARVFHKLQAAREHSCQAPKKYPYKDPILGLDLYFKTKEFARKHQIVSGLACIFSKCGLTFETSRWGNPVINTIEPQNLETVWVSRFDDWGVQPFRLPALGPFCGRGLVTMDGAMWETSRIVLKPAFHRRVSIDLPAFEVYLQKAMEKIPKDQSTVDLQPIFFDMYFEISYLFLVGEHFDPHGYDGLISIQNIREEISCGMLGSRDRIAMGPLRHIYMDRRWSQACQNTRRFAQYLADKALSRRKTCLTEKDDIDKDESNATLLDRFAKQWNGAELRDQIIQFFMVGPHTVAIVLSNVFFSLSRHPHVWRKLRAEVLMHGFHTPDREMLKSMRYLQKVVKESRLSPTPLHCFTGEKWLNISPQALRLYPLFPLQSRLAYKDTILPVGGGLDGQSPIFIPKGTEMRTNFFALHRLPSFGPDPETFRPDRWDTIQPEPWIYVPFGGGPRICLGQDKALTEIMYGVVRMVQHFKTIESRDERDWTGDLQLTLRNVHGVKVALMTS